jgi:uncharacterized repeat protein (TIGR01451 family)
LIAAPDMIALPKRLWQHLAAGFVVLAVVFSAASSAAQSSYSETVEGIKLTFALDKTQIAVGEPVTLTITMENVSPAPALDVATNFHLPEGNKLELMVQPADDLPYRYTGPLERGTYADTPFVLAKGVPLSVDTLLLYDSTQPSGYLFSKPGIYNLAAKFDFRVRKGSDVRSISVPPVRVEVAAGTGVAGEVYEMVDEPALAKSLHVGAATTDSLKILQSTADRFPGTGLGALALRAVGRFYSHSASEADRAKGAQILEDYLARGVVPADAGMTVWDIAAAWHLNKQYDTARQWIVYLVRNYPGSARIREEDPLVFFYYIAPAQFASQVPWYLLEKPWIVPGAEPPASLSPRKVN